MIASSKRSYKAIYTPVHFFKVRLYVAYHSA